MLDSVSFKYFLGALISLVVITNPLSKIPLFMSLAAGMTHEQRKDRADGPHYNRRFIYNHHKCEF